MSPIIVIAVNAIHIYEQRISDASKGFRSLHDARNMVIDCLVKIGKAVRTYHIFACHTLSKVNLIHMHTRNVHCEFIDEKITFACVTMFTLHVLDQ